MHHLLIGASIPLITALLLIAVRRRASLQFLLMTPLAIAAGACWAVVPDIPRLLGQHALYRWLDAAPWTDIFFFHYSIDRLEDAGLDPHLYRLMPLFNVAFVLLLLLLLAIAWRELARAEAGAGKGGG